MTTIKICPKCNNSNILDKKFCPACGFNIAELRARRERDRKLDMSKRETSLALKNCYVLLGITSISFIPLLITSKFKEYQALCLQIVSLVDALALIIFMVCNKCNIKNYITRNKWLYFCVIGALLCIPMLSFNFIYHYFIIILLGSDSVGSPCKMMLSQGMSLSAVFFFVSLMPAVWEELQFRGLLLKQLDKIISPTEAAVLSSALFAVVHLSVYSAPYLFLFGYLLVELRRRSGSIIPGMILHCLHNAVVISYEIFS